MSGKIIAKIRQREREAQRREADAFQLVWFAQAAHSAAKYPYWHMRAIVLGSICAAASFVTFLVSTGRLS